MGINPTSSTNPRVNLPPLPLKSTPSSLSNFPVYFRQLFLSSSKGCFVTLNVCSLFVLLRQLSGDHRLRDGLASAIKVGVSVTPSAPKVARLGWPSRGCVEPNENERSRSELSRQISRKSSRIELDPTVERIPPLPQIKIKKKDRHKSFIQNAHTLKTHKRAC